MKKFIGRASEININILIAIVITIYLIIRSMITQGVASGKCGFTTLRISKYKKPKFLAK